MIRDVDLASYLPEFMANYKEPVAALDAENPEFQIIWKAADRILYNRFISTADEYGINRFEKMLDIHPELEDTLEVRRRRVQARWLNSLPYTIKSLKDLLFNLYGKNYSVSENFNEGYTLIITLYFLPEDEDTGINNILEKIVPENLILKIVYENPLKGNVFVGGHLSTADIVTIRQVNINGVEWINLNSRR